MYVHMAFDSINSKLINSQQTIRTIIYHQPNALLSAVYLITNHIAPAYEGVELGIGSQVLSKALKDVSGSTAKELKGVSC